MLITQSADVKCGVTKKPGDLPGSRYA